jgi:hypothetical protein
MFIGISFWWIILLSIFLYVPSFSGEVYRWMDEKGTIHFTDDSSMIPEQYSDQAKRIEVPEEILKEPERFGKPEGRSERVKEYLENPEKRIEAKKRMEKKISELEEELKLSEETLKRIEEYETENYLYYQPFKDPKTGKWVPVASPYYEEKRRLKNNIESIKAEIRTPQEKLSDLLRSL